MTDDVARIAHLGPEAGGAVQPFFSPDGEMLRFVTKSGAVKAVSTAGGDPLTLVESGVLPSGAAWGADGYVYFDSQDPVGLMRVAGSGGTEPEPVFPSDVDPDVIAHAWPVLLPRGEALLATVVRSVQEDYVAALDIETGTLTPLVEAVRGVYASTGHVLYTEADGSLFAAPVDERRSTLIGSPVLVRELDSGFRSMSISSNACVGYSTVPPEVSAVVWVDRAGNERQLDPSAPLANVRFLGSVSRWDEARREHPRRAEEGPRTGVAEGPGDGSLDPNHLRR